MPRNCLQMNELSQSGLEKYLTTKWKWAVLCSSPPKQCSVVYMEWSLMTEPGWRGGRNVFGGESCLNQLYKSWPLFVYTRTLCKEHEGLPKGKQGLLTDCKCPEIGFNLKQCWEMWWLLILMCALKDSYLRLSFQQTSFNCTDRCLSAHQRHPGPAHRCFLLLSTFHLRPPVRTTQSVCCRQCLSVVSLYCPPASLNSICKQCPMDTVHLWLNVPLSQSVTVLQSWHQSYFMPGTQCQS